MDVDVHALLRDPAEARVLLNNGAEFGFYVSESSRKKNSGLNNILNIGFLTQENLAPYTDETPVGYGTEEESGELRVFRKELTLQFSHTGRFSPVALATLTSFRILPANKAGKPQLSFERHEESTSEMDTLQLPIGTTLKFYIQCVIPKSYIGHLKRVLLFNFDVKERMSALVNRTTTFTMGVLFLGAVRMKGFDKAILQLLKHPTAATAVHNDGIGSATADSMIERRRRSNSDDEVTDAITRFINADSNSSSSSISSKSKHSNTPDKSASVSTATNTTTAGDGEAKLVQPNTAAALSVEAKPFAPLAAVTFFDEPCLLLGLDSAHKLFGRETALHVPPYFARVLSKVRHMFSHSESIEVYTRYIVHCREHTLDHVMLLMELNNLSDVLEHHASNMASFSQCQQLLENYAKLVLLEEIQMKIDIAQFDMHFIALQGKYLPNVPGLGMITKLKIRGSNESRPRVSVGDEIRLRPVFEDLNRIPHAWKYMVGTDFFELRGICMSYNLAAEEAIFEFPAFPGITHTGHLSNSGHTSAMAIDGLSIFNSLRYHARFTFDKCGAAFMRQTLEYVSTNNYMMECFFPTEETIGRLITYFRCHPTALSEHRPKASKATSPVARVGRDAKDSRTAVDNLVSVVPYIPKAFVGADSPIDGPNRPSAAAAAAAAANDTTTAASGSGSKTAGKSASGGPSSAKKKKGGSNSSTGTGGGNTAGASSPASAVDAGAGSNATTITAAAAAAESAVEITGTQFNAQQLKAITLITALAANERRVNLQPGDNPHFAHSFVAAPAPKATMFTRNPFYQQYSSSNDTGDTGSSNSAAGNNSGNYHTQATPACDAQRKVGVIGSSVGGNFSKTSSAAGVPSPPMLDKLSSYGNNNNNNNDDSSSSAAPTAALSGPVHLPLPPFIIFGPPGTGKTSTIIEAIMRICQQLPGRRVLACAPSDAAADVIALRLASHLDTSKLFRLNWWQRIAASCPARLRPYCHEADSLFEVPDPAQLMKYQVVVSTCGVAGSLGNLDAKVAFDVVIVDEASQAIEAEVMVPLSFCKPGGLMVLAGDPNQLGPSTRCPLYSLVNDASSMQERLLRLPFYSGCRPANLPKRHRRHDSGNSSGSSGENSPVDLVGSDARNFGILGSGYSSRNQQQQSLLEENEFPLGVFLCKNYRSHKCILEIPSKLFYEGALEECADKKHVTSLCKWQRLPQHRNFPLLFVGVDGTHRHEPESPSFYNIEEIEKVVDVCKELLSTSRVSTEHRVTPRDIGVIAAFRQQVLKIRLRLREEGLYQINVGSVEDFQGQEVRVVVISTVLSSWVERFETKGAIGLFGDPRRFNVAVTRGMALCCVIGQPEMLYSDPYWRELLKYCHANGAYGGLSCEKLKRGRPPLNRDSSNETLVPSEPGSSSGSSSGSAHSASVPITDAAAAGSDSGSSLHSAAATSAAPSQGSSYADALRSIGATASSAPSAAATAATAAASNAAAANVDPNITQRLEQPQQLGISPGGDDDKDDELLLQSVTEIAHNMLGIGLYSQSALSSPKPDPNLQQEQGQQQQQQQDGNTGSDSGSGSWTVSADMEWRSIL